MDSRSERSRRYLLLVLLPVLALALTFAPELCTYQELPVDVDISGGISMGKTIADFYNYTKKPANMKVALGVRARDFIELFVERMERLGALIPGEKNG